MGLIQTFPDGGGGSVEKVELTQAEYNTLTQEEKNNGTLYFITDAEGGGAVRRCAAGSGGLRPEPTGAL